MAMLFGRKWTRRQLMERVGDMSQLATVRPHTLTEGKAKGTAAIEISTGSGFRFTLLPDRALDISQAEYRGLSLCWRSVTGDVAPTYYQPEGIEWLYSFFGGLVTTCGLTNFGAPSEDQGEKLGLHGRVSSIPAAQVNVETGWEQDEYYIGVQGKIVEGSVFGPCLSLTRTIYTFLGQNRLFVRDEVTNIGHVPAPHMMLYHINLGFPVVDAGSRLIAPSKTVTPRDDVARDGAKDYARFSEPMDGFKEKVYFHDVATGAAGKTMAAVVNPALDFGAYVSYNKKQLPQLIEWKQMGKGVYVVGVEPGTNLVTGRARERAEGRLRFLAPGETAVYDLELGALVSKQEIGSFEKDVAKIRGKTPTKIAN